MFCLRYLAVWCLQRPAPSFTPKVDTYQRTAHGTFEMGPPTLPPPESEPIFARRIISETLIKMKETGALDKRRAMAAL